MRQSRLTTANDSSKYLRFFSHCVSQCDESAARDRHCAPPQRFGACRCRCVLDLLIGLGKLRGTNPATATKSDTHKAPTRTHYTLHTDTATTHVCSSTTKRTVTYSYSFSYSDTYKYSATVHCTPLPLLYPAPLCSALLHITLFYVALRYVTSLQAALRFVLFPLFPFPLLFPFPSVPFLLFLFTFPFTFYFLRVDRRLFGVSPVAMLVPFWSPSGLVSM